MTLRAIAAVVRIFIKNRIRVNRNEKLALSKPKIVDFPTFLEKTSTHHDEESF